MATVLQPVQPIDPREAWLERKRKYVGGSEAFELLNQPQYGKGCATALAFRKLGVEPDFPEAVEEDPILTRGRILEPLAAQLYEEQTGRRVRRPPMDSSGVPRERYHPEFPWAGVNTDRIILGGFGDVERENPGDLEIKTRGEGPWLRVQRVGPFVGDLLQPQWSMFVTSHTWGAIAILGIFGGLPMSHWDVKRDEGLIDTFKREGEKFADSVWGKGVAPAPTIEHTDQRCKVCEYRLSCRGEEIDRAEASALREIKKSKKTLVSISNAKLEKTLHDLDFLKAEKKSLEEAIENAGNAAKAELGEVKDAYVHGYGKAYQLPSQFNGIDQQRLKQEKPDIYADYFVSRKTGEYFLRTYPDKELV